MSYNTEELMIAVIARLLDDPEVRHVAVGAASPIPGSAALLTRHLTGGRLRASIIHGLANNPFTDGGREYVRHVTTHDGCASMVIASTKPR